MADFTFSDTREEIPSGLSREKTPDIGLCQTMEIQDNHAASSNAAGMLELAVAAPTERGKKVDGGPCFIEDRSEWVVDMPLDDVLELAQLERLAEEAAAGEVAVSIEELDDPIVIPKGGPCHVLIEILKGAESHIVDCEPAVQDALAGKSLTAIVHLDHHRGSPAHTRLLKAHQSVFSVSKTDMEGQIEAKVSSVRRLPVAPVIRRHFPTPARCLPDEALLRCLLGEEALRFELIHGEVLAVRGVHIRPVGPVRENQLLEDFKGVGCRKITRPTFRSLLEAEAMRNPCNAFEDEMNRITWDETPRLARLLPHYLRTDDTAYHRELGPILVGAIVARGLYPGCKMDFMPLLHGPQGLGKSSVCSVLAGGDRHFVEMAGSRAINNRDSLDLIRGKRVVELPELEVFRNSSDEAVKAIITCVCDEHRSAYSPEISKRKRTCIFMGTTNQPRPLRQGMSGRRFYPIEISRHADLEGLRRDMPQLYAEARVRLRERLTANPRLLIEPTAADYFWKISAEAETERTRKSEALTEGLQMVGLLQGLMKTGDARLLAKRGFVLEDLVRSLDGDFRKNSPEHQNACRWLRENGFGHKRGRISGQDGLFELWFKKSGTESSTAR